MASNYRNQLESYLKTIDVKAERVLDVGGAAKPVKDRVKTWEVGEYKIADNGLEAGSYDYKQDLNHVFLDHNQWMHDIPDGQFDVVFCLEVFEYIRRPMEVLGMTFDFLLCKGGLLYITFPFLYPIHQPVQADSLRYTPAGAEQLLRESGFTILDRIPRRMTAEGAKLYHDFMSVEKMHPAKWEDHALLGMIYKCQKV